VHDVPTFHSIISEQAAQGGNVDPKIIVADDYAGPDTRHQLVLRNYLPCVVDQRNQQVEGSAAHFD
jgi:hypothetical protein